MSEDHDKLPEFLAKDIVNAKIGTRIASIRDRRNMSQYKLAQMADIERSTLMRIENGEMSPTIFVIHKVAAALDTKVSEITSILD